MLNEAKALIKFLKRKGFNAFFIGGKCRVDLHNIYHPEDKVPVNDIDIITNAKLEEISKYFPNYIENSNSKLGFKSITVTFANKKFEIAFFKRDNTNFKLLHTNAKVIKDDLQNAGSLDLDRMKRDFTINAIVQDNANQYIDFIYRFNRKQISAMLDVYNGIIRCIGTPAKRFQEDPRRILRMLRFQAQLGYTIHEDTWNAALENRELLKTLSAQDFKEEFNAIITSRFICLAFNTMKKFGLFDLELPCFNKQSLVKENNTNTDINAKFNIEISASTNTNTEINIESNIETDKEDKNDKIYRFFSILNDVDDDTLQQLEIFNRKSSHIMDTSKNVSINIDLIEVYTLLLSSMSLDQVRKHLYKLQFIDAEDIERICWIIDHQQLFDIDDLYHKIYNAKNDGILRNGGRLEFLSLMRHIVHIISVLNSPEEGKAIYDVFCFRPYFAEQLRVTSADIAHYLNDTFSKDDPIINDIKEAIIKQLLEIDGLDWPYTYNDYMTYVEKGIHDVLPNVEVNIPKWPGVIDDYGNWMLHHKAIQHFRVPFSVSKLSDLDLNSFDDLEDILYSKDPKALQALNNKLKYFKALDTVATKE